MSDKNLKWFAIATAGATVDGRGITPAMIEESAASYDPTVYGARMNIEHYLSAAPGSLFDTVGDVVALKAGKNPRGELQLLAQIDPKPNLLAMVKQRQKIFTSCEFTPNFARTGRFYLTGLAVTDSPASTGTDALKFNKAGTTLLSDQPPVRMCFAETDFCFTDASTLTNPDHSPLDAMQKFIALLTAQLAKFSSAGPVDNAQFTQFLTEAKAAMQADADESQQKLTKQAEQLAAQSAEVDALKAQFKAQTDEFAQLKTQLATLLSTAATPARPEATGAAQVVTDC